MTLMEWLMMRKSMLMEWMIQYIGDDANWTAFGGVANGMAHKEDADGKIYGWWG